MDGGGACARPPMPSGLLGGPTVKPAIAAATTVRRLDGAPVHSTVTAAGVCGLDSAAVGPAITAAAVSQEHSVAVHRCVVLDGHYRTTCQSDG